MLPNGHIVRDVLLGKEGNPGFAAGLKRGTVVIDTSSSSPSHTQALGKDLAELGLVLVDAPITQTYMHATNFRESTLMVVRDDPTIFSRTSNPSSKCMATYIFPMDGLGSGHAMET